MYRKQVSNYSRKHTTMPSSVQDPDHRCDWLYVLALANGYWGEFKSGRVYVPAAGLPWMSSMTPPFIAMIWSTRSFMHSGKTKITLTPMEWRKAAEIAWYWLNTPVTVELPSPPPVGGATSALSGGDIEGFCSDGIAVAGSVPSTGCPELVIPVPEITARPEVQVTP